MTRLVWLAVLVLVAMLAGCDRSSGPGETESAPALRPEYVAKHWGGILVEFGMPEAMPLLGRGWSYGEEAPDGNAFRWTVADEASFSFESDREGERLGFLEVEPFRYEGAPAQFIGLSVNGRELDAIELREGRARYPVDLPLRQGRNEVALRFRYAGDPSRGRADRRNLAVAFYRFDVPPDDEAPVAGRPGPFAWVDGGIYLPPHATVSFFRPAGELSFALAVGSESAPQLRAPRGAELSIVARSGSELWEDRVTADGDVTRWEGKLPFDGTAPVEVALASHETGLLVRPVLEIEVDDRGETTPTGSVAGTDAANILVIVLDGANALRTGVYGYERDTTPVLDGLARESVVFDVAVSQAVYTIASIGSLLTGQYPERHQTVTFADRLPETATTFPTLMTEAGIHTAAFAGNAVVSDAFGLDRGYETFVSVPRLEGYTGHGDSVVGAFREWISKLEADDRFFAYVHFREPHFPYNPPAPYATRFGSSPSFPGGMADAEEVEALNRDLPPEGLRSEVEALYDGNLAYVDALVGEVLACVDDSTLVVVTADHGEALFEHGFLGHNTQLYEESIRVPLIVKLPDVAPKRVSGIVQLLDLTPTLLELAGLGGRSEVAEMQGESLVPLIVGNRRPDVAEPRAAFARTLWDKPRYAVRTDSHKLIWDSRTGASELYDLEADPGETVNLAGDEAYNLVEAYLRHRLFSWYRHQEKLKAGEPPPPSSEMSPEERRKIEGLGYTSVMSR